VGGGDVRRGTLTDPGPSIREVVQRVHEERRVQALIRRADAAAVDAADPRAETRARAEGIAARRQLVRLRLGTLDGETLATRLDVFLAQHGDRMGGYLLDALASHLADEDRAA
jgi:hypothetical protein